MKKTKLRHKEEMEGAAVASQLLLWSKDMTVADMIGQMSQIDINVLLEIADDGRKQLKKEAVQKYIGEMGVGSVLNMVSDVPWTARQYREAAIELNQVAKQYGRPPVIWGLDSVHGANYIHTATVTPQPINLAATWNASMARAAGQLASRDTRAAGIHWLFAPLLGLATEPRWSRVYETFGEDPFLVGVMASHLIRGIQTPDDDDDDDPSAIPSRAAACAKHFLGYSMPRTGHDRSPSWIPTRHLYQYFVPPWKKAIEDAGALTVMESYTETDGVPMIDNRDALDYLLRHRLNFTGVLVTDYQEIRSLFQWHHIAESDKEAVLQSLAESDSIDVSMVPWDGFAASIVTGIQNQRLSVDRLRTSAERVLQLKHTLRMFDETITIVDPNLDRVGTDEAAVLPMVQDSLILVKNTNDDQNRPLLPLDINKPLKIHVTGPTANSLTFQSGGWTWQWQGAPSEDWFTYGSTVWDSFRAVKRWNVTYSCGVDVLGKECKDADETVHSDNVIDQVKHWVGLTPTTSMAKAVEAAKDADVTVICVGEEAYAEKPGDIRSLRLPDGQIDLVHAIQRNTNTKILLVYFGGRPRLLSEMVDNADAVILGFLPGPSAGQAIVDVITGRVNPSGRLPITYPAADDGGGVPYWLAVTDKCTNGDDGTPMPHWQYIPCPVQWPFGHGLSYTTFKYSDLSAVGGIDDDLQVSVKVTNTGTRAGADTVMFFTFDEWRQTTPEYKRLRAFEKVLLAAGESLVIRATVPVDDLRFVGHHDDRHYILDPSMVSYLGVGYTTDCRLRDNGHNPDDNDLCVRLQSQQGADRPYVAACVAACALWKESNCGSVFGMSDKQCLERCMLINQSGPMSSTNDGWGWTYVNCLEPVVWNIQKGQKENEVEDRCWMMTAMCRDVFQTSQLTESGVGTASSVKSSKEGLSSFVDSSEHDSPAPWLALLSGLLASFMMVQLLRGALRARSHRQTEEDEQLNSIQFITIRNNTAIE